MENSELVSKCNATTFASLETASSPYFTSVTDMLEMGPKKASKNGTKVGPHPHPLTRNRLVMFFSVTITISLDSWFVTAGANHRSLSPGR